MADLPLTPEQRHKLFAVLLAAFPQRSELVRMVGFGLDMNLAAIAGGENLEEIVYNLISKAQATGRTADLIRAALAANPTNIDLRDFAVEVGVQAAPTPAAPPSRPPCPYPGLQTFKTEQHADFFGRDGEIAQLKTLVEQRSLVLIVGPSGSGKSSLVFAGLLPDLGAAWEVQTLRPGPDPGFALAARMGAPEATAGDPAALGAAVAAQLQAAPGQRRLLVVDQAEEVFTRSTDRAAQTAFFAALRALATLEPCRIVLTLRADFYGDLMASALWPVPPEDRVEVAPLRDKALRAAIERPAERVGVALDPGLVGRLVDDAAREPGPLPLVQETLRRLWAGADGLTLAAYEALAPDDPAGRLAVALARTADETWIGLPAAQRELARRVLLNLIQVDEGRPPTRRQRPVADLAAACGADAPLLAATLDTLAASRLITLSGEGTPAADLAHEALIVGWPELAKWLQERGEGLILRRRLEGWVAEWERRGQGSSGLLDEGELAEAARWQDEHAADLGGIGGLDALVARSRARLDEERQREQHYVQTVQVPILVANAEKLIARDWVCALLLAREAVALSRQVGEDASALALKALHRVLNDRSLPCILRGHAGRVNGAGFSPDGGWVVTAGEDSTARLWDAATGQEHTRLLGHRRWVWSAGFSPDGCRVVTAGEDSTARLWDATTGQEQTRLLGHEYGVWSAGFSPDGDRIVTAGEDGTVRLWDAVTGQEQIRLLGHKGGVWSAGFSPDGGRVVTAGRDSTVRLWDAATGQEQTRLLGHAGTVWSAGFSPDGGRVVTAGGDGTARLWDAATGQEQIRLLGHNSWVRSAGFSPDGSRVVTAGGDSTARLWDATNQEQPTLRGHTGIVYSAAFNPGGGRVVTAGEDSTARLWDAATGQEQTRLLGHKGAVRSAGFSPDGSRVVTAGADGTARLWDATTGQEQTCLLGHAGTVYSTAFSPDGGWVVTAGEDGTVRLWGAATGQEQTHLLSHAGMVWGAGFSPDGGRVVTAGADGTARLWDVATGREQTRLLGHKGAVRSAGFSPDGGRVVTAGADGTARLWDVATGREQTRLLGHNGWVMSAEFSAAGDRVVTAEEGGTARLWDVATGQEQGSLCGHRGDVYSAGFSGAGDRVVTAGRDGTARQYIVDVDELLALAAARAGRVLTPEERALYLEEWLPPSP